MTPWRSEHFRRSRRMHRVFSHSRTSSVRVHEIHVCVRLIVSDHSRKESKLSRPMARTNRLLKLVLILRNVPMPPGKKAFTLGNDVFLWLPIRLRPRQWHLTSFLIHFSFRFNSPPNFPIFPPLFVTNLAIGKCELMTSKELRKYQAKYEERGGGEEGIRLGDSSKFEGIGEIGKEVSLNRLKLVSSMF